MLQLAFENRQDRCGSLWKKQKINYLVSAYRVFLHNAVLIHSGLKPKIKIEYIHILEPEINRRIAGMIIDATPAVREPETEDIVDSNMNE